VREDEQWVILSFAVPPRDADAAGGEDVPPEKE